MTEILWIAAVGAAFGAGSWLGKWWGEWRLAWALNAGRSPKARAIAAIMMDDNVSARPDR